RLSRCAARWGLDLGPVFPSTHVSWTCSAIKNGSTRVVLKVQFPHPEADHEGDALRLWNGNGAVRLLDHDRDEHALLLEKCDPGIHLSSRPGREALDVFVDLL